MFGRIFGRGKDDQDQAVCAECGRTLLAGEWTQTVIDEHGNERLICSLCGQAYAGATDPVAAAPAPANNGRLRETRSEVPLDKPFIAQPATAPPTRDTQAESDAFWQALKDKDAQIESLKAELARAEAERQELAARFARAGSMDAPAQPAEPEPGSLTGDSSEAGERTWGETPAEFAAELAELRETAPAPEPAVAPVVAAEPVISKEPAAPVATDGEVSASVFEDTQPIEVVSEAVPAGPAEDDASTGEIAAAEIPSAVVTGGVGLAQDAEPPAPVVTSAEPQAAADSLTVLQRGVDLLNVSSVPRKIAETNEQLGLPHVHVGHEDDAVAVTFMWTIGWYRFRVDLDSGGVSLDDRGYEELSLQPNAGVRADGTVQLAPAQISRAAAQRVQMPAEAAPAQPAEPAPPEPAQPSPAQPAPPAAAPETPREAAQKPPEFLSKSLLGQRSDDETASWEQTKARDFDWDR